MQQTINPPGSAFTQYYAYDGVNRRLASASEGAVITGTESGTVSELDVIGCGCG